MASPQTGGNVNSVLPPAKPTAHSAGTFGGTVHAVMSVFPDCVCMKNWPLLFTIGVELDVTVSVARVTFESAGIVTPPAVIVINTVLPVGSAGSSAQLATPTAKLPQLWNTSVPGSSVLAGAQAAKLHASLTVVTPVNVAGTSAVPSGGVLLLVFSICTSAVIVWLITSDESLGRIGFEPLACTPACAGTANMSVNAKPAPTE
jgi:hypothetical protein